MQRFLDILKRNRYQYVIAVSLVTMVILINNLVDFAEKIRSNLFLLSISLAVFYFFITISIREEIWKNGK